MKILFRVASILTLLTLLMLAFRQYDKSATRETRKRAKHLENNIVFEGRIIDFAQSNNHAFGLIRIQVSKSNVKQFHQSLRAGRVLPDTMWYPYRIQDNIAEIYSTISNRKVGEMVKVISNQQTIYYNPSTSKETGALSMITYSRDIDFIKEHTVSKSTPPLQSK
ncbi:hypothetical protein [Xanthocytophaga agilis]|uniref:Uncharacterized protein n=1 Tax=Xanthocytophaga agilis TaxID=3048010 RepID=A0AAE3UIF2_9BACT|nr:hypothetical protein [Xanthocytophaga agilis]MDJ1503643.1 hypothetical protein [Xanthocytophaga agilis]